MLRTTLIERISCAKKNCNPQIGPVKRSSGRRDACLRILLPMSQAENHSIVRRKSGCAKIYERRKLPKRSRHASDIVSFRNRASGKLQRAVRFRINGFRNRQKERNKKREKETKKGRKKERKTERKTEIRKEMKDSNSDRRREEKKNGNVCPLSGEYLLSANSKMAMMAPLSDEKIGDGESPHPFRNWR